MKLTKTGTDPELAKLGLQREGIESSLDTAIQSGASAQRGAYLTYVNTLNQAKVVEAADGASINFNIKPIDSVIPIRKM